MLAQNFKTAADLGISEIEVDALIKVLGMLEHGEIDVQHFKMHTFRSELECGTVGCLCGWANRISLGSAFPEITGHVRSGELMERLPLAANKLFAIATSEFDIHISSRVHCLASPENAAVALRSYLTIGEANWAEALAS